MAFRLYAPERVLSGVNSLKVSNEMLCHALKSFDAWMVQRSCEPNYIENLFLLIIQISKFVTSNYRNLVLNSDNK